MARYETLHSQALIVPPANHLGEPLNSVERGTTLSRGPGRCQRRVLELLEAAPARRLSREDLEAQLVEREGFVAPNVLRAVRGLARTYRVSFVDRRFKAASFVALPEEPKPISDEEVFELLKRLEVG